LVLAVSEQRVREPFDCGAQTGARRLLPPSQDRPCVLDEPAQLEVLAQELGPHLARRHPAPPSDATCCTGSSRSLSRSRVKPKRVRRSRSTSSLRRDDVRHATTPRRALVPRARSSYLVSQAARASRGTG